MTGTPSGADELRRLTVLYVEDEDDTRGEVSYFLCQHVGRLLTATNGQEGLEAFRAHHPDLVLSDIQMPVMDGLALAAAIKQADHGTPVIFTTAINDTQHLHRAIAVGADAYVVKPIDLEKLLQTIMRRVDVMMLAREVAVSRAQLAAYHQAAEDERRLVADLMTRMMRPEHIHDCQLRYWLRPAEAIGGDLIAAARSRHNKLYVMLADSTGHGLPAALNLLPINHIFYSMVNKNLPIALMVEEMNWAVRDQSPTERYVSALVACIDTRNCVMEVWNGGIPAAFFVCRDGSIARRFESTNFPLGILDRTFTAQTEIYQWPAPGHLVIYSDGLEDVEDEAGDVFGCQRIVDTIRSHGCEDRFDALKSEVETHLGSRRAIDDMTLMMVASELPTS